MTNFTFVDMENGKKKSNSINCEDFGKTSGLFFPYNIQKIITHVIDYASNIPNKNKPINVNDFCKYLFDKFPFLKNFESNIQDFCQSYNKNCQSIPSEQSSSTEKNFSQDDISSVIDVIRSIKGVSISGEAKKEIDCILSQIILNKKIPQKVGVFFPKETLHLPDIKAVSYEPSKIYILDGSNKVHEYTLYWFFSFLPEQVTNWSFVSLPKSNSTYCMTDKMGIVGCTDSKFCNHNIHKAIEKIVQKGKENNIPLLSKGQINLLEKMNTLPKEKIDEVIKLIR